MKQISFILLMAVTFMSMEQSLAQCNGSNENENIQITDTIISPACTQNGQVDIGVSGGTAPYTFSWYLGYHGTLVTHTQNLINVFEGGYWVVVFDQNGNCNQSYAYLAPAFNVQTVTTEDTSCPMHSGTATVIASGGNIPYSYLWSNGATTATITGLSAGIFNCTVSDASGCQVLSNNNDSFAVYIYSLPRLNVNVNGTEPTNCADNNGSLTATASGGVSPYTYQWGEGYGSPNPNWTTPTIDNLTGGIYYSVTAYDANTCLGYCSYSLNAYNPISLSTTSTPQNCLIKNGTATVVANGTTGPYNYLWSTGSTSQNISGLGWGSYTVTVTDANSCSNSADAPVGYYSPIYANVSFTNQECTDTLGTASVAPTLGTPPYTFAWSNGDSTDAITGLVAGYYEVTITDSLGCIAISGFGILNLSPITPNAIHTDQVCNVSLGSATLAPTGGSAPYVYLWSNGDTTAVITGLTSNNYNYTITDANACQCTGTVFINFNSGLLAAAYVVDSPMCKLANGSVAVNVLGGAAPFTYSWNTGSVNGVLDNLLAGYYQVTITDADNCSVVKATWLNAYSPLTATVNATPATCIFTNDGSATVSLSNGTPPYQYWWGNGSDSAFADSLPAWWGIGVYVSDSNGCWADAYVGSVGYRNLNCAAIISGIVVNDVNGNCILGNGDGVLQNAYVQCVPGYGVLTNALGAYQLAVPAGNYALTQQAEYRNQGCPVGSVVLDNCAANTTYSGNNFYDWPLDVKDLRVSFDIFELPQPGFTHTIQVYYQNDGLFTVTNAQVAFIYDSGVTYAGGGDSVDLSAHTIFINCPPLAPSDGIGSSGYADLSFTTPAGTPLGTIQTYTANITPVIDDATPLNNTETAQYAVVSWYDPNYLVVAPAGSGAPGYISTGDSVLKYTIHFQNTGNFQTSFIAIRDTLDANLDLSSIQPGASSVPVTMELQNQNTLVFLLNPIYLPDSAEDPVNSIGMVSFYIKQRKGLMQGTQIHNRAGIYFDFNLPVATNSTLNTLTNSDTLTQTSNTGIDMQLLPNPMESSGYVEISLQNKFTGTLVVTDLLGRKIFEQNLNLQNGVYSVPLNLNLVSRGMYLVYLSDGTISHCLKLLKE